MTLHDNEHLVQHCYESGGIDPAIGALFLKRLQSREHRVIRAFLLRHAEQGIEHAPDLGAWKLIARKGGQRVNN